MAAIFNYSPLPENHIRLVRIESTEEPPICELYDAPFNDDLRFRAISYAWGSDKLTHRIKCNDMIMAVTQSVADMFSSTAISDLCIDMPLWVDAVCINQRDDDEKAAQVRMMASLYSQAEEVIVWLGTARDDSDSAMRQIKAWSTNKTFTTAKSLNKLAANAEDFAKAGLKPRSDPIYNALEALYCRSWFTRLWVFQEIVLAQRCRVFCGSIHITLEQLVSVSRAMRRLSIYAHPMESPHKDSFLRSLRIVSEMGGMKQVSGKDEPLALGAWKHRGDKLILAELMKLANEKSVTNPHDRVYGLIELATPEVRKMVSIDYSDKSPTGWAKTYIQCAKACIKEDATLSILLMLSDRPRGLPLPSWCPNFNANQRRLITYLPRSNAGILEFVQHEDGLPKAWVEEEKDVLFAPGCQIDHVEEIVSSTYTEGKDDPDSWIPMRMQNLAWERQCQSLSQRTLGTGIEKDVTYIQTLMENIPIPGKGDTDLRRILDHTKYSWSEGFSNAECNASTEEDEAVDYFVTVVRLACEGRIFFSTRGGRIGVGPPGTQPGDLICILYGAKPLYMLRRQRHAKEPLQILGDAFVHGCTDLDDMYEQVRSSYEVFEIG